MDADRLNRWLSLVANIGVLAGLALLIVEIRQSNLLAMAEVEQTRSDTLLQWRREWVTNDHIAPMLVARESLMPRAEFLTLNVAERQKAAEEMLERLDPETRLRMRIFILTSYWDYENLFGQYQRGLISDEYWNERIVVSILQDAPQWIAVTGGRLPSGRREFIEEIKRLLDEHPDGQAP